MLFLTAIPDDFYFLWQLEIQLYNFSQLGINPKAVHVLVAHNVDSGLQHYFSEFIENQKNRATFFVYADKRKQNQYIPSIRPYLIQQHLQANPEIEDETFFYYDTDIIFRELPDFEQLYRDDNWYVADTRRYLDSTYIKSSGDNELFLNMCAAVGIPPKIIENNDINCGGAQYLIKKSTAQFWGKVEKDCETLYEIMQGHNFQKAELCSINGERRSEYKGIQSWCADMWAVLWNAFYFDKKVQIHSDLNFCWPTDDVDKWNRKKILHYAGNTSKDDERYFRKANYVKYPPYYDEKLKNIPHDNCSYPLAQLIESYRNTLDEERTDLQDVSFLIPVRIDSDSRLTNLYYTTRYLSKYYNTNIIIAESDREKKVDSALLPPGCTYYFLFDNNKSFHRTKINNWLINQSKTPFIAIYDTDVIVPIDQINTTVELLRTDICQISYPYDGLFIGVDSIFKEMFGKILDDALLTLNQSKFIIANKRSFGGAVFLNRQRYIQAGMENEHFTHWGPEDIERSKRMRNLGYKLKRAQGPLFHLPHLRAESSSYQGTGQRIEFMEEYLKISKMSESHLKDYIETWPWCKSNKNV